MLNWLTGALKIPGLGAVGGPLAAIAAPFAMKAIGSALTPRGTNAANKQQSQQSQVGQQYAGLFNQAVPLAQQQIGFQGQLESQRQATLQSLIRALQSSTESETRRSQNAIFEAATRGARTSDALLRNQGLSSGYRAGHIQSLQDQAARQAARIAIDNGSPTQRASRLMAILQAIAQQSSPSSLGTLGNLASGVNGQPRVQVQQGAGEDIGYALGQLLASGVLGGGSLGGNNQLLLDQTLNPAA